MRARDSAHARTQALWEAEMARRALAPLNVPVVLLKGTAFHAAGFDACIGRSVGDLDILVPRDRARCGRSGAARGRLGAGQGPDGYDDAITGAGCTSCRRSSTAPATG